jgi:hypothetical protein
VHGRAEAAPCVAGSKVTASELRDVAEGLWVWRTEYPDWRPGLGWERVVSSTCVESGGEVAVLDALAPADAVDEVWARLDARPPTLAVVLKPDHVRDVDLFVRRYNVRPFGPYLFWRTDVPDSELEDWSPEASFRAGSSPSTTAAAGTRRRSGCPSSACSCSPTP